jgi:hypothetical protein
LKLGWNLSNLTQQNFDHSRVKIALQPLAFIIAIGDHGLRRPTTTSHDLAYLRHVALPSLTLAPNVSLI